MNYRKEIDGLRALAVVPVIFFHSGLPILPGGFIGVDVFFVISGYLITSLLAEELEDGRYRLAAFYERRARRILPALYLVMFVSLPLSFIFMLPSQLEDFSSSLAAVVLFLSNFFFLDQVGYFSPDAELQPLLHTWSLAVEEQYYLLYPPLLAFLWRRGRRWTLCALAAMTLLSLLFCVWGAIENPGKNFYFTGSRAWELLAGALAALLFRSEEVRCSDSAAMAGLAMVLGIMLVWKSDMAAPGVWTVVPVVGTVLILVFARADTHTARFLGFRGFVGIGLISYSAYLWHQPLFAFARLSWVAEPPLTVMAVLVVLTFLLAWATWVWVERPVRRRRMPIVLFRKQLFFRAAMVGSVLLTIGVLGKVTDGFIEAWRAVWPDKSAIMELVDTARLVRPQQDDGHCRFNIENVDDDAATRILSCYRQYGPGIAILGDSHAIDLFGIVFARNDRRFVVGLTKPACRPTTVDRDCPYASFSDFAKRQPTVFEVVLFEMAGAYLLRGDDGRLGVQSAIKRLPLDAVVPALEVAEDEIVRVNAVLADLAQVVPVVWVGPRIEPQVQLQWLISRGCAAGLGIREGTEANFARLDNTLKIESRVPYLSQNQLFDLQFPRDLGGCDGLLWSDGDHFSKLGLEELAGRANVVSAALAALR